VLVHGEFERSGMIDSIVKWMRMGSPSSAPAPGWNC
jgi:hypothetical protein